jgi:hypothetical protein
MSAATSGARRRLRLSSVLAELDDHLGPRESLTLGEVVDRTAHAGFGFLIALLALLAIPFVGLSTPFGLAIGFVGAQMLAPAERPWLPARVREHVISRRTLRWLAEGLAHWTARLERVVQPRLPALVRRPAWMLVGVGVLVQGLGLALPLPVPGSNWIFIAPILVYALGMLEDDGVLILVGHAITAVQIALAAAFWVTIVESLGRLAGWLG